MWFLLMFMACGGTKGLPPLNGIQSYQYFPFDGERVWSYTPCFADDPDCLDTGLGYRLKATNSTQPEIFDGRNVYTITFEKDCFSNDCVGDGQVVRRLKIASSQSAGVFLYAIENQGTGLKNFNPPIELVGRTMLPEEFWETTTGGSLWTSTMVDYESCPLQMAVNWTDCARFELETTGTDGEGLAGTIWANAGWNITTMTLDSDDGLQWRLNKAECNGNCDGRW